MSGSLVHWAALFASVLLAVASQLVLRVGARRRRGSVNVVTAAGLALFGAVTVLMVYALQAIDLKSAIAVSSLTYVGTPLAERVLLGEHLARRTLVACHVILAGVLVFLYGG